ncbi:MAG: hypothetical protein ACI4PZ_00040 [Akkermansia sp.]
MPNPEDPETGERTAGYALAELYGISDNPELWWTSRGNEIPAGMGDKYDLYREIGREFMAKNEEAYDKAIAEHDKKQQALSAGFDRYLAGDPVGISVQSLDGKPAENGELTEQLTAELLQAVGEDRAQKMQDVRGFMEQYVKPIGDRMLAGEISYQEMLHQLDGLEAELMDATGDDQESIELAVYALMNWAKRMSDTNAMDAGDELMVAVGRQLSNWANIYKDDWEEKSWEDEISWALGGRERTLRARGMLRNAIDEAIKLSDTEAWYNKLTRVPAQMLGSSALYINPVSWKFGLALGTANTLIGGQYETTTQLMGNGMSYEEASTKAWQQAGINAAVEAIPFGLLGGPGANKMIAWATRGGVKPGTIAARLHGYSTRSIWHALGVETGAGIVEEGLLEPVASGLMEYGSDYALDLAGMPHGGTESFRACFRELQETWNDPYQIAGLAIFSAGLAGSSLPRVKSAMRELAKNRNTWKAMGLSNAQVDVVMGSESPTEKGREILAASWADDPAGMTARVQAANKKLAASGSVLFLTGQQAQDAEVDAAAAAVWQDAEKRGWVPHIERQGENYLITKPGQDGKPAVQLTLTPEQADVYLKQELQSASERLTRELSALTGRVKTVNIRESLANALARIGGNAAIRELQEKGETQGILYEDVLGYLPQDIAEPIRMKGYIGYTDAQKISEYAAGQIEVLVNGGMDETEARSKTGLMGGLRSLGSWANFARDFAARAKSAGIAKEEAATNINRSAAGYRTIDGKTVMTQAILGVGGGNITTYGALEDITEAFADRMLDERARELEKSDGVSYEQGRAQALRELHNIVKRAREAILKADPNAQIEQVGETPDYMQVVEALSTMAVSQFATSNYVPKWMSSLSDALRGNLQAAGSIEAVRAAYANVLRDNPDAIKKLDDLLGKLGVQVGGLLREARMTAADINAWRKSAGAEEMRAEMVGNEAVPVSSAVREAEETERQIIEEDAAPVAEEENPKTASTLAEEFTETLNREEPSPTPENMRGVFDGDCVYNAAGDYYCGLIDKTKLQDGTEQVKVGARGKHGVIAGRELTGEFQASAAPLIVWKRKDGSLRVISGRHRYELMLRDEACKAHLCYVYEENEQHNEQWARLTDYENNMRDDQADELTAATYVRETGYSDDVLRQKGLMLRNESRSKRGALIGRVAREELWVRFKNGSINAKDAEIVCKLTRNISDEARVEDIQRQCCQLLEKGKSWDYIGAMCQLMANKDRVTIQQGLLNLGADFEQDMERAAEYVEQNLLQLNAAIRTLKQGAKLGEKERTQATRLGIDVSISEGSEQLLQLLNDLKAKFENIGTYPDLVADASLWDGKTAPDPVGQMLDRAKREREEADAENALTDEEWLEKKAREQAAAATPTLFAMERRVRMSADAIREHADGADADGKLRTHGLEGLSEEQAQERAFEQAGENIPMMEKLVKAAAEKLGGRSMMRRVNKENGLATKKPSTARNKANRDYRGKIERVVDLIGGTVELPMNGDYAAAVETVQGLLPDGADVAKVKKLGFTTDTPSYKDVKVSVRFPNGGIGEIIIVDAFVNDAKFNRGGHVIYEIVRELEQYEDIEDVKNALDRLRELSGIVYDSFADAASLERAKSSASSALERLQPSLKNIALSSGVMGMVKSPDLMSKVIKPASVDSTATPSFSLTQNISGSDIAQNGEEFKTKNAGNADITLSMTRAQMDARYMDAVERGDMDSAQRMVNEVARKRGYLPGSDYQGTTAFNGVAPGSNGYFDTADERYEAWQNGDFEGEISLADFVRNGIDPGNLEWMVTSPGNYQRATKYERESIDAIRKAKASKHGKVTIYRAVPVDVKEKSVRNGDWVTLSKAYAAYHISLQDWEKGRIIKQEVSIDDLWWDGNDLNEWGYDDGKAYAYRNTANNRKLLEPVTYDENGDIVPLSKRFNYRSENVSFSMSVIKAEDALTILRKRETEREGERLIRDWQTQCELWAKLGGTDDAKIGRGSRIFGELLALVSATRGVLPPKYTRLRGLAISLQWAEIYVDMVNNGEVPMRGVMQGRIYDKFVSAVEKSSEKYREYGLSPEEVAENLKELAGRKLEHVMQTVAVTCRRNLERYLKDRERERLEKIAKAAMPKEEPGKKTPRGKVSEKVARQVQSALELMDKERNDIADLIDNARDGLDRLDPDDPEYSAKEEQLQEQAYMANTFGDWSGMTLEEARAAADTMAQIVSQGRAAWKDKLDRERRHIKYIIGRVSKNFRVPLEEYQGAGAKRDIAEKSRGGRMLSRLPLHLMNFADLMLVLRPVLGKEFCDGQRAKLAEYHIRMQRFGNDLRRRMMDTAARITGLKSERDLAGWINDLNQEEHTGIHRREKVEHSVVLTIEDAQRWLAMSESERAAERERLIREAEEAELAPPADMPTEEHITKLQEALAAWQDKDEAARARQKYLKATVTTERDMGEIVATKEGILYNLLLLEQDDYQHLAEANGLDAAAIDALKAYIGPQVMTWGYAMRQMLQEQGKELAKYYEAWTGVPFPSNPLYFPGAFDMSGRRNADEKPDQQEGISSGITGGKMGCLIKRRHHNSKLDWLISATQIFRGAMHEQYNYICVSDLTREWRSMLTDREFARRLKAEVGADVLTKLNAWVDMLDGALLTDGRWNRVIARILRPILSCYALSRLAGNVYTWIKQASGIVHGFIGGYVPDRTIENGQLVRNMTTRHIGFAEYWWAFAKCLVGQNEITLADVRNSKWIKERDERYGRTFERATMLTPGKKIAGKVGRVGEAFTDAAMDMMETVDINANAVSMLALVNAVYDKAMSENKDGLVPEAQIREVAMKMGGMMIDLAAQPKLRTQKSFWGASNTLGGVISNFLMLFKTESLNKAGLIMAQLLSGEKRYAIGSMLTFGLANTMILYAINWVRGYGFMPGDDDDEWWETAAQVGYNVTLADFTAVPIIGEGIDIAKSRLMGGKHYTNSFADMLLPVEDFYRAGKREARNIRKRASWDNHVQAITSLTRAAGASGGVLDLAGCSTLSALVVAAATAGNLARVGKDVYKRAEEALKGNRPKRTRL